VVVSIASDGLESDLAFRTRLLDAAWGGVPSVAVAGGSLAAELSAAGAGRRVPRDAAALAAAVTELLCDGSRREAAGAAARAFAARRSWREVVAPLAGWLRDAAVDPGRQPLSDASRSSLVKRFLGRAG
jgi:glycosyltransferase involved in cell wall biosynthesis